MSDQIEAIFFDVGGTLRRGINRPFPEKVELCKPILELTGWSVDPEEFARMLDARANAYRKWSRQELAELNDVGFWTRWMLPELGVGKVSAMAVELNRTWRDADRIYQVFPDTRETLLGLFQAGYRLGVVSNTSSSVEAPDLLNELGVAACFEVIVLSCQIGIRKPRPDMLLEAARQMCLEPRRCAYVGNLPDRDVAAARRAGFNCAIILRDPNKSEEPVDDPSLLPDHYIDQLKELLSIFPARDSRSRNASSKNIFDVSLSTMWGIKKFPDLNDFLSAASRLGFAGIELNHQVSPAMLEGLDLANHQVSSIHEPCPAVISADDLKKQDLLISSPNEERRREGVNSIKRSIDLAKTLGSEVVVVHCGQVQGDWSVEREMIALLENGQAGSQEYQEMKKRFEKQRAALVDPYLDALQLSLSDLLDYAGGLGVRLGIENRYHYPDIPTQDEMSGILGLAGPERLGFIFDVGHAYTQDHFGFYPYDEWLKRFESRIIGTHLHDVIGIHDHLAPGLGDVDFGTVASYLPKDAFRTLEVKSSNTPEQIKAGIKILVDTGCVKMIE